MNQANTLEDQGLFKEAKEISQKLKEQTSDFDIAYKAENKIKELSGLMDIDKTISQTLGIQEPANIICSKNGKWYS